MTALTLSELLHREAATITVPAAGEVLGIGRDASYAAAARGEIPTLRLGHRLVVPVPKLLELLGVRPPAHDIADAGPTTEPASEATTSSPKEASHAHGDPQPRPQSSNVRSLRP